MSELHIGQYPKEALLIDRHNDLDLGLVVHLVDPNEVQLQGRDTSLSMTSDQAIVGSRYVDNYNFVVGSNIPLDNVDSILEGHLEATRRDLAFVSINGLDHDNSIKSFYLQHIPKDLIEDLSTGSDEDLISRISNLPDNKLSQFLLWNYKNMLKTAKEKQPFLGDVKREFSSLMKLAIDKGLPLDKQQLDSRLEDSRTIVVDPIGMISRLAYGFDNSKDRLVRVSAEQGPAKAREAMFKELMHLVGGNTVFTRADRDYPDDEALMSVDIERVGVAGKDGENAPTWIQEAVNEQLTRLMLDKMPGDFASINKQEFFSVKNGAYQNERSALEFMLDDADVPQLLAANFENATPKNKGVLEQNNLLWERVEARYGRQIHDLVNSYDTMDTNQDLLDFKARLNALRAQQEMPKRVGVLLH